MVQAVEQVSPNRPRKYRPKKVGSRAPLQRVVESKFHDLEICLTYGLIFGSFAVFFHAFAPLTPPADGLAPGFACV